MADVVYYLSIVSFIQSANAENRMMATTKMYF